MVKKLFTIPLLPHRKMVDSFKCLLNAAKSPEYNEKCSQLLTNVNNTWFNNVVWSSKHIYSYQRLVRTNNDCEGYHRRLKERCGTYPPIYKLVENLYREAILVDYTCKLKVPIQPPLRVGRKPSRSRPIFKHCGMS